MLCLARPRELGRAWSASTGVREDVSVSNQPVFGMGCGRPCARCEGHANRTARSCLSLFNRVRCALSLPESSACLQMGTPQMGGMQMGGMQMQAQQQYGSQQGTPSMGAMQQGTPSMGAMQMQGQYGGSQQMANMQQMQYGGSQQMMNMYQQQQVSSSFAVIHHPA